MRTRELHYYIELVTCVGCLCVLIPKYPISSREYFVVLCVMTGK